MQDLTRRLRELEMVSIIFWAIIVILMLTNVMLWSELSSLRNTILDISSTENSESENIVPQVIEQTVNVYISNEETTDSETNEEWESIGIFDLTAYCPCEKCCGQYASGRTASGTTATAGRTIAADTDILPFGTRVMINGHEYVVEDRGGGVNGNHIDIFYNTHEEALAMSTRSAEVFIFKEE